MNWKTWLKTLASAAIGGAVTGAAQAMTTDGRITKQTAVIAGAGALLAALAYLKQSPLP
jgi:hypothetical protein